MDDNHSKEYQDDTQVWSARKAASSLATSFGSMDDDRKEIIRQALKFDIIDIRTYLGYKGDSLLEVITMHPDVIQTLKKTAEDMGFDTVVQKDTIDEYKLFCIKPATDIYDLKE